MDKNKKEIDESLSFLAKSAVIVLIGLILSKIFSYIYRIMIARIYGPDIYGIFFLAFSIVGLLIYFVLLGFDSGIVRNIPLYKSKKKTREIKFLLDFSFWTILIFGLFIGLLLFLFSETISIGLFHEPRLIFFLQIFSILVPVIALTNYFLAIINGYEKIGWFSFIENIWKSTMNILFLTFLVLLGIGYSSVPLSFLLAGISTLILSYIIVQKYTPHISKKVKRELKHNKKKEVRNDFLKFSVPLLFFNVISVLMAWIDSFSLGYFKSATEVGIYQAAVPIALLLYLAPQLFTKLLLPLFSREYGNKKIEVIKQLSQQVGKWILLINLPLFLILFLFSENFINLLFGNDFISSAIALRILLVGVFFLSICRVSNRLLTMAGKTKTILVDIIIAVVVNLILNAVLIPMPTIFGIENKSGINGAAIATTLASILIGGLFLIQGKISLSIAPFRRKMINLFAAGGIAIAVTIFFLKFIQINIISLILISLFLSLLYIIFVFILKGLDKNDFLVLGKFSRKLGTKNFQIHSKSTKSI
tara:strand:+ start:1234 stop:2832 length:1599 start_codon:yes stop_codon:yes gene_type:complete